MPVIQRENIVAAGALVDNALSGSAFEFLRRNAIVSIGVTADIAAQLVTIQSGGDIVLEESPILAKAAFPTIPDDMYYNDVGVAGDRLVVRLRNSGGAPSTIRTLVQITDLN